MLYPLDLRQLSHYSEDYLTSPETSDTMYRPSRRYEWLFCGALLAQAIIILALEM